MSLRPSQLQGDGTQLNSIDAGLKDLKRQPNINPRTHITTVSSSATRPVVVFPLPVPGIRILNVLGAGEFTVRGDTIEVMKQPLVFYGQAGNRYYGACKEGAILHDFLGKEVLAKQVDPRGLYQLSIPVASYDGKVILFNKHITLTIIWEYI